MPNPAILLLDSDALIQLSIKPHLWILREFKARYGMQTVIVPEVENEVLTSRRYAARVSTNVNKSIGNGNIRVLERAKFTALLQGSPVLQASAVGVSYADIQALGAAYNRRIDTGESYTFAAGVKLQQPAVSNDNRALKTMHVNGFTFPPYVFRAFDLIVFAYQAGLIDDSEADSFRKMLLTEGNEAIPAAFEHTSFAKGLAAYRPRLLDSTKQACGTLGASTQPWASTLFVVPT
jgi:hypothetical protein